jgi:N-acetylglutamate synthase and related acetyltransferases
MNAPVSGLLVRAARTPDVRAIRRLVDEYSPDGNLLAKAPVTLFEDIQEFVVAEIDGEIVGCGALHVMWEDLAEVRTLAVSGRFLRQGIGSAVLNELIARARPLS